MNLLFDLDGTLTDPKIGIVSCIEHALTQLGRNLEDYSNLERFIGPPLLASFEEMLGDKAQAEAAVEFYRERFGAFGLFENTVYDGIEEVLGGFKAQGHNLYVATSKPRVFADRILAHFELAKYFKHIYGSELDGRNSAKKDLIAHILKEEKISSSDAWMIGDRSYDIVGATANKVLSVGVLWGYGSIEELASAGATALCELPEHLESTMDGF